MRLVSNVLMPNHWHLVVWPSSNGQLSQWAQWLTVTHVRRWHSHHHTEGTGPVYQGRFKSFPIQENDHYFTVCRYAERNPLRANLVTRAEDWRWSSLWHRHQGKQVPWLTDGPLPHSPNWTGCVNEVQTEAERAALRRAVIRGAMGKADRHGVRLGIFLPPPRQTKENERRKSKLAYFFFRVFRVFPWLIIKISIIWLTPHARQLPCALFVRR